MTDFKHDLGLRAVKLFNGILIAVPFAVNWYLYYALGISVSRVSELVYSQMLAAAIADVVLYVITYLLMKHLPNPLPLLGVLASQLILAAVWTMSARTWYFLVFPPRKTAVVYDKRPGLEFLVSEYGLKKKFDICLTVDVKSCLAEPEMLDNMDTVFLSGVHSHDRNIILKRCIEQGIDVYVIPRIGDTIMSGAKQAHILHLPILNVGWHNPPAEYLILKRMTDVLIAGIAVIITLPVMAMTSMAIKLTDGGPIFYRQKRLTKGGKEFYVLKFRSMRVDAEKDGWPDCQLENRMTESRR